QSHSLLLPPSFPTRRSSDLASAFSFPKSLFTDLPCVGVLANSVLHSDEVGCGGSRRFVVRGQRPFGEVKTKLDRNSIRFNCAIIRTNLVNLDHARGNGA